MSTEATTQPAPAPALESLPPSPPAEAPPADVAGPAADAGQLGPRRPRNVDAGKIKAAASGRRLKYLREKIKAAKDATARAAAEAELAEELTKNGQGAADRTAATRTEGRKADPVGAPATPAEWEDPNRPGWPKPELIARQKAKWAPLILQGAELLDDTPFSLAPRQFPGEDGTEITFRPLAPMLDAWAAVRAKKAGTNSQLTPEEALRDAFEGYALAVVFPGLIMWGRVKMAEANARAEEARTERAKIEAGRVPALKAAG